MESGEKVHKFVRTIRQPLQRPMTFFTSEYETRLDAKGRLALPARIKAQLPEGDPQELVLRRGFEPCLMIYPMVEFKKVYAKISALSEFNEEYRRLQRSFLAGVQPVELDSAGRFLIPKALLQYAHLDKDVLLVGTGTKLEAWNRTEYEKHLIQEPSELSELAEKHLME